MTTPDLGISTLENPSATSATPGPIARPSAKALWTGRVLTGLVALFLLIDAGMKVLGAAPAVQGTVQIGYPASAVAGMGWALLVSAILYLIPRTSVLGAALVTAYLGGAVASNVRVSSPFFSFTLVPVYIAIVLWAALWLRDLRFRTLFPLRSTR